MSVASVELCKRIQEVSHWIHGVDKCWVFKKGKWVIWDSTQVSDYSTGNEVFVPAYSLGFLIRKLEGCSIHHKLIEEKPKRFMSIFTAKRLLGRQNEESTNTLYMAESHSPENAAGELALKLLEKGYIK